MIVAQDNLFMVLPIFLWVMSFRPRRKELGGQWSSPITIFGKDHPLAKIELMLAYIWTPPENLEKKKDKKENPREKEERRLEMASRAVMVLAFIGYGLPQILTLRAYALGSIPPSQMDWPTFATALFTWLSLSGIWLLVRRANATIAIGLKSQLSEQKGK